MGLLLVICNLLCDLARVTSVKITNLAKSGKDRTHPNVLITLGLSEELIEYDLVEGIDVAFLVVVDQSEQVARFLHISSLHVTALLD